MEGKDTNYKVLFAFASCSGGRRRRERLHQRILPKLGQTKNNLPTYEFF